MRKFILIGAIFLVSFYWLGCAEKTDAKESNSASITVNATPVKAMPLKTQSFSNYLSVTGTVAARNHINILVEEGGTLKKVLKEKGRYANSGELLAILENKILEATFKQANAALQQAQLDNKSKTVLYEKRAISENEFLNSKYKLQSAQANYDLAKARYDKLHITAPISGLVNDRYYDLGAYANPMTPMFEFIDNEVMKVRAGVAERFLSEIHVGTPTEITFDAYPDVKFNATVSFVSRSIDPKNRTFLIEVQLPNNDHKLAPEMVANVRILREELADQIVLPLDVLMESEKGWYVFIADGNTAKKVFVTQEAIYQNKVMVKGLHAGQLLIYTGQRDLSDGDIINVLK